jgi:hypothetical protein
MNAHSPRDRRNRPVVGCWAHDLRYARLDALDRTTPEVMLSRAWLALTRRMGTRICDWHAAIRDGGYERQTSTSSSLSSPITSAPNASRKTRCHTARNRHARRLRRTTVVWRLSHGLIRNASGHSEHQQGSDPSVVAVQSGRCATARLHSLMRLSHLTVAGHTALDGRNGRTRRALFAAGDRW